MPVLSYTRVPFDPAVDRFRPELALAPDRQERELDGETGIVITLSQARAGGPFVMAEGVFMLNHARCFGTWNGGPVSWRQLVFALSGMFEVVRRN